MKTLSTLSTFLVLFSTSTILCHAQSANQFRTTLANSTTYILQSTGTYYTAPGSYYFSDITFTNTGSGALNEAAVYVQGNNAGTSPLSTTVFTGSNLLILGSGTSGNSRRAMVVYYGADAFITSSTISQTAANAATGVTYALYLADYSHFTGSNLLIEAVGPQVHAILVSNNLYNRLVLDYSLIQNSGSATALQLAGSGVTLLSSSTIKTTGAVAPGVQAVGGYHRFALDDGLIHASGANAPGLWLGSGNLTTSYGNGVMRFEGSFTNALVRADNGMGIEINTDLPSLQSRPVITNPQITWAGYYDLTIVSSTISGALGAARMTSSATNGGIVSEIPTIIRFNLADSLLDGTVSVNDGARFILNATSSRLDGALRLSGSAPIAEVTLVDSSITGGIVLTGGASLSLSADNTSISGTLAAAGNSHAKLLLSHGSTIDSIALDDFAILELTMDNSSRILGDFSIRGGATYTLLPADNRSLTFPNPLTLATGGNLRVAPGTNLTLASPLTFADPAATITLANVRGDDLILSAGLIGTGRLVVQDIHADALGSPEMRVIRDDTNSLAPDTFKLVAPATNRLFAYHALETRPDGAWLTGGGFSSAGAAILDTPALAAADFFDALSPISKHLALLRENDKTTVRLRHADADSGTLWLSARTGATVASAAAPGLAFNQQTSAFTAGADFRRGGRRNAPILIAGLFTDAGYAYRDFGNDATGNATIYGAGFYALYQRPGSWHTAATARFELAKNTLTSNAPGSTLSGDYSTRSAGLTLEFGLLLPGYSPTSWWAEPSVEVGVATIGSASYETRSANPDNRFHVAQDSSTAAHARAQVAFGRDLGKKWSLRARFAAAYLNISGGGLSTSTADTSIPADVTGVRFHQIDGFRAEVTAGIVYRLGSASRLWADCDTVLANGYKRPWTLTLGWSTSW